MKTENKATKPYARWTSGETELLIKYYPDMSDADLVRAFLPDKTVAQVRNKAGKLALRKSADYMKTAMAVRRRNSWTEQENRVLLENYGTLGPSGVAAMLPRRTYQAIQAQAGKLGLTRGYSMANRTGHATKNDHEGKE